MTTNTQCTTDDDTSVYDYYYKTKQPMMIRAYMTSRYYPVQLPMMIQDCMTCSNAQLPMMIRRNMPTTTVLCAAIYSLIVLSEVKVYLVNFDIKFRTKFLCIWWKKKYLFLQKCLPNLFNIWCDITKWRFDVHFDVLYFCQKSSRSDPLPALLTLGFTAMTDHMRVEEVLPGCGPQSGAALVRIPISFQSRAIQSSGMAGSHWGWLSCTL